MKKLLILGANPETVSLILKAKEMGIYTIVTDYDPQAYAKVYADLPVNIDAVDVDALVELAKKEQIDGVLVGVAEALLPSYCELCNRLGLPCYSSIDIFEVLIRKDLFKQKCREYNVPTMHEYDLNDTEIVYPVIVKPVDSCSSKGIRVCKNYEELDFAVTYALEFSKCHKCLIEEYLEGDEVISYYVIQDGCPMLVGMCDRYTYKGKSGLVQLPTSYIFPSRYIDLYLKANDLHVKNMIKGLGIKNGSIFFQSIVGKDGIIHTYETGYRLNGAQEHIIISKVSGIDAKELYINFALTGRVSNNNLEELVNPKPNKISCKLSPLVSLGKIMVLDGLDEIAKIPGVLSVNPSYRVGDTVVGEGTLKQIIARFFIVSDTKEDLFNTINEVYSKLKVINDSDENMLVGLFDPNTVLELY